MKNGMIEKRENAYIGDSDAFNKFQELHLTYKDKNKTIIVIDKNEMHEEPDIYPSIEDSFSYIIDSNMFDTVGGMKIECSSIDGKFQYSERYSIHTGYSFRQVLMPGEGLIFKTNNNYYAMHFEQIDKYIVHKPGYSNENYKYLSLPVF